MFDLDSLAKAASSAVKEKTGLPADQLLELWQQLDEEQKQKVIDYAKSLLGR